MWTIWVAGQGVPVIGVAALGVIVGFMAGMFGIGGGFLMTPLLVALFRVPLPIAVGSGLCQMVGTSLVSYLRHRSLEQGEDRFDLLMLPGSLLGVELGARALTSLEGLGRVSIGGASVPAVSLVVQSGYVALLSFVAWNYWRHGKGSIDVLRYLRPGPLANFHHGPLVAFPRAGLDRVSAMVVAYIGLGMGFLSGLLGIGGGVALNPILIYGYGFPMRQAVGTGIVVLFATAVTGTVAHALRGHVSLPLVLIMLVGGAVSAQLGALWSKRMSGGMLGRVHAVVIAAAVVAVVWDLARRFQS
jgi:hypothetical protein